MDISITDAILAVRKSQDGGHAEVGVHANSIDHITWYDSNPTNITKAQIEAKAVELQADFVAKQYQRDRTLSINGVTYPSIEDQLDMLWHDKKDGTTTWEDAVQAVKDANPKP
jgi:hypothetical protein